MEGARATKFRPYWIRYIVAFWAGEKLKWVRDNVRRRVASPAPCCYLLVQTSPQFVRFHRTQPLFNTDNDIVIAHRSSRKLSLRSHIVRHWCQTGSRGRPAESRYWPKKSGIASKNRDAGTDQTCVG